MKTMKSWINSTRAFPVLNGTLIPVVSNEVMKSRGNNCKIVREAGGESFVNEVAKNVEQNGHLHRGQCRAVKSSGELCTRNSRTIMDRHRTSSSQFINLYESRWPMTT